MSNETPIYDLKDLSKKLKISVRTLREYVKRGELKAKMVGKAYYVTEPCLMDFLDSELAR
jgi:predicted site-specific integrase-resolvase